MMLFVYPARGESRLGCSLNSILISKCNLPQLNLPLRENIRQNHRDRINMKKTPTFNLTYGQSH